MRVVDYLREQGLVEGQDFKEVSGGKEILTACKQCPGKSHKLYINSYTGAFKCHRCGSVGLLMAGKGAVDSDESDQNQEGQSEVNRHKLEAEYIECLHQHLMRLPIGSKAKAYLVEERGLSEDVLTRMKIGYDPTNNAIAIPNLDMDGNAYSVKYRSLDPDAPLRYFYQSLGGRKQLPYNLKGALEAPNKHKLVITEGEIDALSYMTLFPDSVVIGMPGQDSFPKTGSAKDDKIGLINLCKEFKVIYLYPDRELGSIVRYRAFMGLLRGQNASVVVLPHNDMNESIVNGVSSDDVLTLERESTGQVTRVSASGSELVHDMVDRWEELGATTTISTGFKSIDSAMSSLRPGELTLLAGDPKSGKSTLGFQIAFNVAKAGHQAIINSLEMDAKQALIPRFISLETKFNVFNLTHEQRQTAIERGFFNSERYSHIFDNMCFIHPETPIPRVPDIRAALKYEYKARAESLCNAPVVFMVIDNLSNFKAPSNIKEFNKFEWVGEQVADLKQLTREFPNLHIMLLCHLRKRQEGDSLSRSAVRGSTIIQAECDNILLVAQDDHGRCIVQTDGIRHMSAAQQTRMIYEYNQKTTELVEIDVDDSF